MTDALKDFKTPITSSHIKSCDVESSQTPFRRPHLPSPISDKKTPHSTLVTASSCTEYEGYVQCMLGRIMPYMYIYIYIYVYIYV